MDNVVQQGLLKMLNYLPMIYNQRPSINDGNITIRYPYKELPKDALLFVLPLTNSLDNTDNYFINTLTIEYATVSQYGEISYDTTKTYHIMIENIDGTKRAASTGDIVANKLCMFRVSNVLNDVILCNNPIYNNIACSSLLVSNDTTFGKLPEYEEAIEINGIITTKKTPLATQEDIKNLNERLALLEQRLQIGTESPEDFFGKNKNLPDNTIYFQTEE